MHEALVVVDLQTDFCPGGALAVPDGDAIVPLVNRLLGDAAVRVLTADWHPPGHRTCSTPPTKPRSKARFPACAAAKERWPGGCQSAVRTRTAASPRSRFTSGTIASPSHGMSGSGGVGVVLGGPVAVPGGRRVACGPRSGRDPAAASHRSDLA